MFWKRIFSSWGFKDVVKNPKYWDIVNRANADVNDVVQESKTWSDEKVAASVRHFIFEVETSRKAWGDARILRELGERTHPTILKLLGDPTLYEKLITPTGEDLGPEAPFNRASHLLGDSPPGAAVEVLAPFLNNPSGRIRKDAAIAIAKTGAPSIVPLVKKAFMDQDEYVGVFALMGLEYALNRDGLDTNLRHELFSPVMTLLQEGKNADKAANVLFRLNNEGAKEYFLSEEAFTADSQILPKILNTLANANVSVPRDRLLGLIKALEIKETDYSRNEALSCALRLLGQHRCEQDREFLRLRMASAMEAVAQGASDGLLSSYGLHGFEKRIWEKSKLLGYEALSQDQKFYCAVTEFDGEIRNGGLSQYFVNSSGNRWSEAVAAFEAMGMTGRQAILKEATAFFGAEGPSTNRDVRQNQLAKICRKNDSAFDALNSRYYKHPEIMEVWVSRYVLEHPDGFR